MQMQTHSCAIFFADARLWPRAGSGGRREHGVLARCTDSMYAHHFHERLRVTLAASSMFDEPSFSSGTDADAVHVAPLSNLLST